MPGIKDISDLISDLSANKLSNLEELKLREVQNMIRQAQEGNLEFFKNFRKPDDAMKFYAGEGGQKKLEEFQSGDWGKQFTDEDKEEIYQSIMDQRSGGMLSKLFREMDAKIDVKGKGMADINRMTAPLGYKEGGLLDKISDFFKYQRKDPERFFGGRDGMEFHLDDPSLIQFIKRKAGTDDEDSPEYQDELMRFMEEVSSFKKNQGGIMSMAGGGLLSSVGNLDTKVKKLELMEVLSLAEIDELDNMSASQIDKLYKEKFGE